MVISANGNLRHVKRENQLVLGDGDRGVWFQGMPHAQFIECVWIVCGDVGDHNVGVQQLLVHRYIDIPRVLDLVGPLTLVTGGFRGGLDNFCI